MIELILDPTKAKPGPPLITGDLGYDEYAGTLSPLGQVNLMALKDAPKETFRYIRIHNIFTSKEGDHRGSRDAGGDPVKFDPNGQMYYDWTIPDAVINSILRANCIPFLELGFSPTPFSTQKTSNKKLKRDVDPPSLYPPQIDSWGPLVSAFLNHIIATYGKRCLEWPIELWNEPDILYFKEPVEIYCQLWEITQHICKEKGMKIVGGPGVAQIGDFFLKFLEFTQKNQLMPDFISFHAKCGSPADAYPSAQFIWGRILAGKEVIDRVPGYAHIPIWITEFDELVGCELGIPEHPKWVYRNTNYYAAWLGKMCCVLTCLQQSIAFGEMQPDPDIPAIEVQAIFNDAHHITAESTPFYGARCLSTPIWVHADAKERKIEGSRLGEPLNPLAQIALLHQPSLRAMMEELAQRMKVPEGLSWSCLKALPKPIFRAFEYTQFLKGNFLPIIDVSHNIYGVLAVDQDTLHICITDQVDSYEKTPEQQVRVQIKIPDANVWSIDKSIRIDEESANPYQVWIKMGSPIVVNPTQYQQLEKASHPSVAKIAEFQCKNGSVSFNLQLNNHSFQYIKLKSG